MSDDLVLYEVVDERIATITLNRPDKANAQTPQMLDDLDELFMKAANDKAVRVIVLQANGKHFSAGHDISGSAEKSTGAGEEFPTDFATGGLEAIYEWETKRYLGYARKWRDIRKPTIAAVQGQCIAGRSAVVLADAT